MRKRNPIVEAQDDSRQDRMTTKYVGIWIRVSTEDQARGESPEHHEKRARYYAESKGWQIREVYHLEAVSGKSVIGHAEAERMLGHIRSGHITGLIFSKLARLARNTRELLDFADIFGEHDADLVSLGESIDTTTPAGRLFYTMIAAMAQWEREEISERVAASVPIRAKLGKPTAGLPTFGYHWVDKKLVPHPEEAPVRKLIYELFLEHRRKRTVARLLNQQGHRTRNGSKWSDTSVARLIRDPTAKGVRRANYTTKRGGERGLKPKDEWVFTTVEPIIPEDLWMACNAILDERQKTGKVPSRKRVHLFSGFTHCACGQRMYVPSNTPKYVCPKCRNKIPIVDLEGVYHEQLKGFFFSESEIAGYLSQADQTIKDKEQLLRTLEAEQARVQEEMKKVYRLYVEDKITGDGFAREYKPLEERLKAMEDQVPHLQAEVDFLKIQYMSSDEIISEAKDLWTRWPDLAAEEKRQVVENITEKLVIGKDEVDIQLCYLPSPSQNVAGRQRNLSRTATTSAPCRSSWGIET
jgi:site-specific DNA recombinase